MFELIGSDCIYDEVYGKRYDVKSYSDMEELVRYINDLILDNEDLKLNTVSSNIYHLQSINEHIQKLIDYNGKHELYIDINKEDNEKLIELLEELEKRGDTYLHTSIILAKKLGFESADEFLNAVDEGFLEYL